MFQRRRHGRSHASQPGRFRHPKSYKVICPGCGKEVIMQVPPPEGKQLRCLECFIKSRTSKEET